MGRRPLQPLPAYAHGKAQFGTLERWNAGDTTVSRLFRTILTGQPLEETRWPVGISDCLIELSSLREARIAPEALAVSEEQDR